MATIIKELITKYHFSFKKKWGQNFLIDNNIVKKIVAHANVDKDTIVIEIGTGAGTLTRALIPCCKQVVSYEIDLGLKPYLEKEMGRIKNLEIIFDNFLDRDLQKDIGQYSYKKMAVVANLPYYITTPIITKILNEGLPLEDIVITIQKEFCERLLAKPNTKAYNSLSIFIDYHFEAKKLFIVKRHSFWPQPTVDSVVIKLKRRKEKKVRVTNEEAFFKFVREAFKYKRKTLKNNLKNYPLEQIEAVLQRWGHDLMIRAEGLSIEQLAAIYNNISREKP